MTDQPTILVINLNIPDTIDVVYAGTNKVDQTIVYESPEAEAPKSIHESVTPTPSATDLLTSLKESQESFRAQAEQLVKDATKEFFENHGDIVKSFGWTQYAPYFNDGEPCEFSLGNLVVHEDARDADEIDDFWYGGSGSFGWKGKHRKTIGYGASKSPNPNYDKAYETAYEDAVAIYELFAADDKLARSVFGDDSAVLFTAEGVRVEDYSDQHA